MEFISYIRTMKKTQYEGYSVNENGDIFSTKFNKVRKLKPRRTKGYLMIVIYNNKAKQMYVHRLVAQTFIPNPENKLEVNHKNGIKWDNRVENLEWATRKENNNHAYSIGLITGNHGEKSGTSKLTEQQVLEIRQLYAQKKYNQPQLAKVYGISRPSISMIVNKKTWNHI